MLHFRPAYPSDIDLLTRWDQLPHMRAANPNATWDWADDLTHPQVWREQWIAHVGQFPIGFVQILNPEQDSTGYWGDVLPGTRALDIWIGEPDWLGKGWGRKMMHWALTRAFDAPHLMQVLVDPLTTNLAAHAFYRAMGFECIQERQFGPDVCSIFAIQRKRWNQL